MPPMSAREVAEVLLKKLLRDDTCSPSLREVLVLHRLSLVRLARHSRLVRLSTRRVPVNVVADLHGELATLRTILARCGEPSARNNYLFLGDYVDRALRGVETVSLVLVLLILYPRYVVLLRGNHEDVNSTQTYGFYDECIGKYGPREGDVVYALYMDIFNHLPIAATVVDKVFCMHGGWGPTTTKPSDIDRIKVPTLIPSYGQLCDIAWADPAAPSDRKWRPNCERSISVVMPPNEIAGFLKRNDLLYVIRGHQLTREHRSGLVTHANGHFISIFSAYSYSGFMNRSSVLRVDPDMTFRWIVFVPTTFVV